MKITLLVAKLTSAAIWHAGSTPQFAFKSSRFLSGVPDKFYWTGAPGDAEAAHAMGVGRAGRTCYASGSDRFCLKELYRETNKKVTMPTTSRVCSLKWMGCKFKIQTEPLLGQTIKMSQAKTFNVSAFLEQPRANPNSEACTDTLMDEYKALTLSQNAWLGRVYLHVVFRLEFYPRNQHAFTKHKIFDLHVPLALDEGSCDSVYSFSS
ncbi:hypothetical protein DSO57_1003227 [Entomophthora muscae]|uniref:Uncharacterized protein n=1 Tax=Entomophthora muscae TaxID=34485 RepID=A0ACC2TVQ8_9FUNG|nr:hypothetical protein DSO57_1003227 [Entomophthora muscae]